MRSLVVFGRGGPRGPPARPRYLSQAPPKLQYNVQSILKGNPFEILASTPEKSYSEVRAENDPMNQLDPAKEPVVHHTRIPDSYLLPTSSKCPNSLKHSAPDSELACDTDRTDDYSVLVRGRQRSQYFNKKITQSKKFTQKLKESLLQKKFLVPISIT